MAYEIDTATGYLDLQARIEAFAVAQGWTVERSTYDEVAGTDGELILSGPGLGGGEAIVVGIRSYSDPGNDQWNFALRGFTAFDGSAWDNLPGASAEVYVPLWDSSLPYWLICNGQRMLLMVKVSTYFMHAHLGFLNTYSTASEYPYPLYVAGTSDQESLRYTDIAGLTAYWSDTYEYNANGQIYGADGQWRETIPRPDSNRGIWPWGANAEEGIGLREGMGVHVLLPAVLYDAQDNDLPGVMGEIDGLYWVSGFGAGVEDTVTVGTQDYIVGQDVQRSSDNDHCALELS